MEQNAMREEFKALPISRADDGSIRSGLSTLRADQLDAGEVTIKVA